MTHRVKIDAHTQFSEYVNMSFNGDLRVSMSEEHDEILVYRDGQDEPEAKFSLETGEMDRTY